MASFIPIDSPAPSHLWNLAKPERRTDADSTSEKDCLPHLRCYRIVTPCLDDVGLTTGSWVLGSRLRLRVGMSSMSERLAAKRKPWLGCESAIGMGEVIWGLRVEGLTIEAGRETMGHRAEWVSARPPATEHNFPLATENAILLNWRHQVECR